MYQQRLDPLVDFLPQNWSSVLPQGWSPVVSTLLAFLPVFVLFTLLVVKRWHAPSAGATAGLVALLIAGFVYKMPWVTAIAAYLNGMLFGLLPIDSPSLRP